MSGEWLAVLLRFLLIAAIYIFLLQVVAVIRRDLASVRPVAATGLGPAARLRVIDGGHSALLAGQTFDLVGVTSIGRGANNAIRLDDEFVSTDHALITLRDRHWWLEDRNTTNGTLLNGRPIDRPTLVSAGDQIDVGRVRFRLEVG